MHFVWPLPFLRSLPSLVLLPFSSLGNPLPPVRKGRLAGQIVLLRIIPQVRQSVVKLGVIIGHGHVMSH